MTSNLAQIGFLLFVSALVAMLSRRVRIPYSVGLVSAGILLFFLNVKIDLSLSKELIFYVFLPPLVFEAALCIRWSDLKRNLPVIALLVTIGVLVSALFTAAGMRLFLGWDWVSALVFGTLIAATDPVAVIATFKDAGLGGRLRLLIEAESLLNDGTAAVFFVIALGLVSGGDQSVASVTQDLVLSIAGGVAVGLTTAVATVFLAGRTTDHVVELSLTTLVAYGSFYLAEHWHFSGVLAALAAGLVVGNFRAYGSITEAGRHSMEVFWEYIAYIANSIIFLLIGAQEAQQHFSLVWLPALVAIGLVLAGRAVAIYPLCGLFAASSLKVPMAHQHVLFWGGLRGALALALALSIPPSVAQRDLIVSVTFAVVAFSVFAQGMTIPPLLRRLGLLA